MSEHTLNADSEYQLTVIFTRNMADDLEVAREKYPNAPDDKSRLIQQLRDELQTYAYDEGWVSGSFQIKPETFEILREVKS